MDIISLAIKAVNDYFDELNDKERSLLEKVGVSPLGYIQSFLQQYQINNIEIHVHNKGNSSKKYSIKEIFEEYIEGEKFKDFYDVYGGNRRRAEKTDEVFQWDLHSKLIYGQLDSTYKILDNANKKVGIHIKVKKWSDAEIPEGAIPNLILFLRMFYHPVMKAFRTDTFKGIEVEDWRDFIAKMANYSSELASGNTLNQAKYAAEVVMKGQYYEAIAEIADTIKEFIIDDLLLTEDIDSLMIREKILNIYETNLKNAIITSREQVQAVVKGSLETQENIIDDLINLEMGSGLKKADIIEEELRELLYAMVTRERFYNIASTAITNETFKIVMRKKDEKLNQIRQDFISLENLF